MNNEIKNLGSKPLDELKTYFEDMDLDKLKKLRTHLDDLYYNVGDSGLSDFRYDVLKEVLDERAPDFMEGIGAKVGVNESAKLDEAARKQDGGTRTAAAGGPAGVSA